MSLINVSSLTFGYAGSFENVFENAAFSIDTNWKTGFIGRNGRGKTTFLNLLLGNYSYLGTIAASVCFAYFPFKVQDTAQTGLEIAEHYLGFDFMQWQLSRELSLLEVDDEILYRPFSTLSPGEQTKLLLAILFLKENAYLLIDEPTNHLDAHARQVLANYLNQKQGFILVSHDRDFLDATIDHVLSINRANIQVMKGNFTTWFQQKSLEDRYEIDRNAGLKKDIKRLEETAKEKAQWSHKIESTKIGTHNPDRGRVGHLAAKAMKRSKNIEHRMDRQVQEKSGLMKNLESADTKLLLKPLRHPKQLLVECRDLGIFYEDKRIFGSLSFAINQGDRCVLRGRNGSGKSSVIKLLLGEEIAYTGTFQLASGLTISYVSQSTQGLRGSLEDYCSLRSIDPSLFLAILRKLDFKRSQFEKPMEQFSQGQRKKVLIAGSLCKPAHLFIWDEPLNYIDVLSRIQIEALLIEAGATLLFVEHDMAFNRTVATKIIDLDLL